MKGYLIKDLLLIKNQKRTLPLFLLCGIVMAGSLGTTTGITYLAIMAVMLCTGTISYDEMDHGFTYLFTLPATRRTYVREKYVFSILVCLAGILIGFVINAGFGIAGGNLQGTFTEDALSAACGAVFAGAMMLGVMIPVRLKYGTEKSSTVMLVAFALAAGAILLITKSKDILPSGLLNAVEGFTLRLNDGIITLSVLIAAAIILGISEQISERIVDSKEY